MLAPVEASGHTSQQAVEGRSVCLLRKEALPEPEEISPPPSQPEKLKIKSKPSSGFGRHPAQPLAGSTAPTFHDFRTFPKLRQLAGEEGERRKTAGEAKTGRQIPRALTRLQGWPGFPEVASVLPANSGRYWELSGCRELEGV